MHLALMSIIFYIIIFRQFGNAYTTRQSRAKNNFAHIVTVECGDFPMSNLRSIGAGIICSMLPLFTTIGTIMELVECIEFVSISNQYTIDCNW